MTSVEPFIARRLAFLIEETAAADGRKDDAVSMVMRKVSNFATLGRDGSSATVKKHNPWMSRRAYDLALTSSSFKAWHDATMNEHPVELDTTWRWIVSVAGQISVGEVFDHFARHPMVTVTHEENRSLQSGHGRYKKAAIEVGTATRLWTGNLLTEPAPKWILRELVGFE